MSYINWGKVELASLADLALIMGISILAGLFIQYIIFQVLHFYNRKRPTYFIQAYIERLKSPLYVFIPALITSIAIPDVPNMQIDNLITGLLKVVITASFAWILIRTVYLIEDWISNRYKINNANGFKQRSLRTQLQLLRRFL